MFPQARRGGALQDDVRVMCGQETGQQREAASRDTEFSALGVCTRFCSLSSLGHFSVMALSWGGFCPPGNSGQYPEIIFIVTTGGEGSWVSPALVGKVQGPW